MDAPKFLVITTGIGLFVWSCDLSLKGNPVWLVVCFLAALFIALGIARRPDGY